MAAEIGANVELAKRGGLLHDIGKVLVNEIETSHAIVGGEFIKRFGEKQDVINAVMAHHNEVEFETVEAILVQAADAVSASRPGARRETLTAYIKRLENLEEIANSFEGVESSYAIQAGRELRIVINPDKVSDDEATLMSREVAKKNRRYYAISRTNKSYYFKRNKSSGICKIKNNLRFKRGGYYRLIYNTPFLFLV